MRGWIRIKLLLNRNDDYAVVTTVMKKSLEIVQSEHVGHH